MKHTLLPALCLALLFTGCAADSAPAYDPGSFACTLAIDSVSTGESGYFLAEYVRADGDACLTVTAPERLAGLSFTFSEAGCVMDAAGTAVPLSEDAAASLAGLAALLGENPEDASERKKTADGTLYFFPTGQLLLDSAGFPVSAETTDGRRAAVTGHSPVQ